MHRPALLFLLTLFSLTAAASAQLLDRILAVVDGAAITQSDATAAIRLGLVAPGDAKDPLGTAVDMLVERRLMLEEVDRYAPPDPPEAEIARRLAEIRARAGNQYVTILEQSGLTEDQLRREVRNDLRIEAYLQQRFGAVQSSDERGAMIRDWLAGLRRRANINVLPR